MTKVAVTGPGLSPWLIPGAGVKDIVESREGPDWCCRDLEGILGSPTSCVSSVVYKNLHGLCVPHVCHHNRYIPPNMVFLAQCKIHTNGAQICGWAGRW